MSWERRGNRVYYYTAERVGGRVVKRYVGTGEEAELIARLEAATRERLADEAEDARREREELAALAAAIDPLDELADVLTAVALVAAGFHRHHRGPWRKRRA